MSCNNILNQYQSAANTQSGCVNAGTSQTGYATGWTLNTATSNTIDGVHKGITVIFDYDTTGTGSPTLTDYLMACPSANYTASTGVCSSGSVNLYSSGTVTPGASAAQGSYTYNIVATSTAGNFIVTRLSTSGAATSTSVASSKVTCSACSSGSWYLYPAEKWSAATSGNYRQLTAATVIPHGPIN